MGKNNANSWLNAVKKAFRSPSNDHEKRSSRTREENEHEQEQENKRGKRRWIFSKNLPLETTIQHNAAQKSAHNLVPKLENSLEERRVIAVAMATTAAAQAAVATAQAAVEIIRLSTSSSLLKKETKAAIVIQTIFRGYLARRALLALKGVVQLQALIRGHIVRIRAKTTLKCIKSLVRVQARVCDQRRRLSFEATSSRKSIFRDTSNTLHSVEDHPFALEEIQSLVEKAKECSLKQEKTLLNALSNQMWRLGKDYFSDNINHHEFEEKHKHKSVRQDHNLCNQTDPITILEIDTSSPYNHKSRYQHSHSNSPKTPSSSSLRSTQAYSCSPRHKKPETTPTPCSNYHLHRMSIGEKSCHVAKPNYMAATASAMARVRSSSTPRQRPNMSPSREVTGSAKKRLSFPDENDGHDRGIREETLNETSCCTY